MDNILFIAWIILFDNIIACLVFISFILKNEKEKENLF